MFESVSERYAGLVAQADCCVVQTHEKQNSDVLLVFNSELVETGYIQSIQTVAMDDLGWAVIAKISSR